MSTNGVSGFGEELVRLDPECRAEFEELAAVFAEVRAGSDPAAEPLATTVIPAVRDDGTIAGLPSTKYRPAVHRFWKVVHRHQLCATPFDRRGWLNELLGPGADPLDPALVAGLPAQELRRYLTALERLERFADGTWRVALERGVFSAVIERIMALDNTLRGDHSSV